MKKKFLLVALAVFTTLGVLMAQGPGGTPEERAKRSLERLKTDLSLTDQQQKDMLPIYTDYYTSMTKLRESGNFTPEDRQKLSTERNEKLKKVLSEDQMKKLAESEAAMRQRMGGGGGGN